MKVKLNLILFLTHFSFVLFSTAQNEREKITQQAIDAYNAGNLSLAADYFGCIIDLFPNDSTAYFDRGLIRDENCEFEDAIEDFTAQIAIDKKSVDSYFIRGMAYEKTGRYTEAIKDYEEVVKLEYDNSDAHAYIGLILYNQGEIRKAKKAFKRATETNPNHEIGLAYLGWINYNQLQSRKGNRLIEKALKVEDENLSKARFFRALSLIDKGNFTEATRLIFELYKNDPFYKSSIEQDPFFAKRSEEWDAFSAEVMCKSAFSKNDTLLEAKLLLLTGHAESAMSYLKKIVFNSTADFGYTKSLALMRTNQMEPALASINETIQQFPVYPELYLLRAEISKKMNEHEKACEDYFNYLKHTAPTLKIEYWSECQKR